MTFVLQTVLCQGGDWSGKQKKKRKKKEEVGNIQGGGWKKVRHFKCRFGSQISLKINQTGSYAVNEAKIGNKTESD